MLLPHTLHNLIEATMMTVNMGWTQNVTDFKVAKVTNIAVFVCKNLWQCTLGSK